MKDSIGFGHGLILGGLISLLGGMYTGGYIAETYYRQTAIEHGCAEYHPQTGEFTWRENEGL